MTLHQLLAQFPEDNACKSYLTQRRWPNGVTCPRCGNAKVWHVRHRPFHWICKQCNKNGYRFSVITKTVFENTKYPLSEWFKVILIVCVSKKGMSALQIQRMLGMGSYRTAWYMRHRIRAAMKNGAWDELMGEWRVDEASIGGEDKNRYGVETSRTGVRRGRSASSAVSRTGAT